MLGRLVSDVFSSIKSRKAASASNPLAEYFFANPGRLIDKWHHYFEIYHRHFARFRARAPVVLEIGVFHGGSLQMWRHYFGRGARIVGIDIHPACSRFAGDGIDVLIGDQADRAFLAEVRRLVPHVDILIDDGGHTMAQQIATLEELYAHVQPHGVYLCEDLHTSYMAGYGGGLPGRQGTFVERSKTLIDRLMAWHSQDAGFAVDELTRSTHSLHFYDSVLVIEKRPMQPPQQSRTGKPSFAL